MYPCALWYILCYLHFSYYINANFETNITHINIPSVDNSVIFSSTIYLECILFFLPLIHETDISS